ncbi:hypothetical protein P7H75_14145 [Vagococcus carniphilus]|uniref:hypothetical protein n=1 Tax=Vagococcus carniphilus TaxID=218144 RepID=UPI00288DB97E|nr:hypothetical protein [Vagococcus carniphilus]MDT2815997.1 hypothetical protein [Vagococcus carniphilus]
MNFSNKDIIVFTYASKTVDNYNLIKNDYVKQKLYQFIIDINEHEENGSFHGVQSAYSCLIVVLDLLEGNNTELKLKFTDKRKLIPYKNDMLDLATRMNDFYHFDN